MMTTSLGVDCAEGKQSRESLAVTNRHQNVRTFFRALSDFAGKAVFELGPNPSTGHLAVGGPLKVSYSGADTLFTAGRPMLLT
jgi:hypothetical protein